MAEKLIVKKYPNRRLYDTEKSAYVSLNQVAEAIRQGREIQVLDARTKEDVTAFILTQIILEEARNGNFLLPVPLLRLIIQYGENILGEFFEKYLEQTITNYLAYKTAFDEQFRKWLDLGMGFSKFAQQTVPDLGPYRSFLDLFPGASDSGNKEKSGH
jgi:polyhydroxyalkanoate synthesis repressor PhaR